MSPDRVGWMKEYKWVMIDIFFKNLIHQVNIFDIFDEYLSCLKYKHQQCSRSNISSAEMMCTKYGPFNFDGCA